VVWKQEHTKLKMSVDWKKEAIIADVELMFSAWQPSAVLSIDARGLRLGPEVEIVSEDPMLGLVGLDYSDSLHIKLSLSRTCTLGDTITVKFSYRAHPGSLYPRGLLDQDFGQQGLYFVRTGENWGIKRPADQVWTQGETHYNPSWLPCLDQPNQKHTQEFHITVDTPFTALSNGRLAYILMNKDGSRTFVWKQAKPHAPYLSMLAIGQFDMVNGPSGTSTPLSYYLNKGDGNLAPYVFGETPDMLTFFSQTFGVAYPWDKYAQVVVKDFVSGAMENTGSSVFGDFVLSDSIGANDFSAANIVAHELAHQWFGNLVTCESWAHLALNESFATYAEYLWAQHRQGPKAAFDRLWGFRQSYLAQAAYAVRPIIDAGYPTPDDMFDPHSYAKGAMVLHQLRIYIGMAAFQSGLRAYLKAHAYGTAEVSDLRKHLEKASGLDLRFFFDQWFETEGHPQLQATMAQQENGIQLQLVQAQVASGMDVFAFWLPLLVGSANGQLDTTGFLVNKSGIDTLLPFGAKPQFVSIYLSRLPLATVQAQVPEGWWMAMLRHPHYIPHRMAMDYFHSNWQAISPIQRQEVVLANNLWGRGAPADDVLLMQALLSEGNPGYDISPLLSSENPNVVSLSIHYLSSHDKLGKRPLLDMLQIPSYTVKTAAVKALRGMGDRDVEEAILLQWQWNHQALVLAIGEWVAAEGSVHAHEAFRTKLGETQSTRLLDLYMDYLSRTGIETLEPGLDYLVGLGHKEPWAAPTLDEALGYLANLVGQTWEPVAQLQALKSIEKARSFLAR
jgi:aminopeptidase N